MERLIDADEVYKVLTDYYNQRTEIQHKALKEAIERVPTVDAVEVVRCKDCIHRYHDSKYGYMCVMDSADPYDQSRGVDDGEWYCADGERRQDE